MNKSTDFIVNGLEEVLIQDDVFISSGNIIVERGGKLILRNVKVIFPHKKCYEYGIILKENTTLEIYQSEISGVNNLFFFKAQDTRLIIVDTKIRMTHIICGNSSQVMIIGSDLWALHSFDDCQIYINNSKLNYVFLRDSSFAKINNSNIVEVILYDRSKAEISNCVLKNIFYFDEGSTTLINCSYIDLIRYKPKCCSLIINVVDEITRDPIYHANVELYRLKTLVFSSLTNKYGVVVFQDIEEGDYIIEIEKKGYIPLRIRISLINEIQNEKFIMRREVKNQNTKFSSIMYILIIFSLFLLIHIKSKELIKYINKFLYF